MRPHVTLTYAQSLDGSLGLPGRRVDLSGPEALKMTHSLRAAHDAILIGIGTALVDDPRLTVRLVEGPNPQPVVLDTRLRLPLTAALLHHPDKSAWLAAADPDPGRAAALETAGARVLRLPKDAQGRVDLPALLELLGGLGIRRLMVEGGAGVIGAFLDGRLANRLVVTVAPKLLGGLNALARWAGPIDLPQPVYRQLGPDLIVEVDLN